MFNRSTKKKTRFSDFLTGDYARDYINQDTPYDEQIEQVFQTQGSYYLIQCKRGCHPKTYDVYKTQVLNFLSLTKYLKKTPFCGSVCHGTTGRRFFSAERSFMS